MAVERDIEAAEDNIPASSVIFDESGNFIMYPVTTSK